MKSDRIKNWPKEERPRERLLTEGADKLTEAELLAIILRGFANLETLVEISVPLDCFMSTQSPH